MKGGRARRRPLASALSHSGFVCMGPVERGLVGEERARVLSLKSKSLCASHPPPGCGPRKSSYEGAVSVEGAERGRSSGLSAEAFGGIADVRRKSLVMEHIAL